MGSSQLVDPTGARVEGTARRLAEPPGARYAGTRSGGPSGGEGTPRRSGLRGPLLRATIASGLGALALTLVGAILASTAGLLFVAGATGAATGLVLARASVPHDDTRPVARGTVVRLALALSLGAVAGAAVLTWLVAVNEGGTLGLVDYLWTTFGPFVPGEALVAAIAAAWGASAGPVQR